MGVVAHRRSLAAFVLVFLALFVGFAVAQGIGSPSVPSGDVAIVEGVPDDISTVSQEDFKRALFQAAAQAGLKRSPKPDEAKFEEIKKAAMGELLDAIWIQGQAEEMGFEVTKKEMASELEAIKEQNFGSEAEFKKFLKEARFTKEDVDTRVKLQILSTKVQQALQEVPDPSQRTIEDYYDTAKATQFTQPPSRDIRAIVNKDEKKAAEAKAALEKDDSEQSWRIVAKKYSEDEFTKATGGLQAGLTEESGRFPTEAEEAMFVAKKKTIEGPIKTTTGFVVFEVEKETPENVQPLDEVKSQIGSQLKQQAQQEKFSDFVADYQDKWTSRTFCAGGYAMEKCDNYSRPPHPETASPACYEADPKGGTPADCPAPVQQTTPVLPGTVSILTPQGERKPQRPRPAGLPAESEAPTAVPGLEAPLE